MTWLLQHILYGTALEHHLEASTGPKCSGTRIDGHGLLSPCNTATPRSAFSCFQVQLNMLIVIYKALHDIGLGYLRKCLSPLVSAWPLWSCRVGILWIPLFKQCYLLWQHTFSIAVPALWNEVIPEIWLASSLLLFRRMIKIWFFTQSLWWGRLRHLTSFHLVMTLCLLWPREASEVCLSRFPCSILTQFVRLLLKADLHRTLSTWEIC